MGSRAVAALLAAATLTLVGCASGVTDASEPSTPTTASSSPPPPAPDSAAAVAEPVTVPVSSAATTPKPKPNPCARNAAGQLVRVKLDVQRMWLCTGHRLDRTTPITSGISGQYTSTPTGTYTVQALTRNTTLTLISGQTYAVKYWIPFDSPLFGFHDSSWQDFPYGSQKYRTDGSHGCVHVPLAAIRFLYHWADIGAKVRITP